MKKKKSDQETRIFSSLLRVIPKSIWLSMKRLKIKWNWKEQEDILCPEIQKGKKKKNLPLYHPRFTRLACELLYQLFTHWGFVVIEVFYFWAQMLILLCSSQNLISYSWLRWYNHIHIHITHTNTLLHIKIYFPFQETVNQACKSERSRKKYTSVAVNRSKRRKMSYGCHYISFMFKRTFCNMNIQFTKPCYKSTIISEKFILLACVIS